MPSRLFIPAAWLIGPAWIGARRRAYLRVGRALSRGELLMLGPYFGESLLASVRIAEVERIESPGLYGMLRALRLPCPPDLSTVSGMAFGNAVVLARSGRELSVLFHELVHVVQWRELGVRGFVARYVREWVESGGAYLDIPMERMAFEMQGRFDQGDVFDVESEVAAELERPAGNG
jgi:hypothetical protein